MQKKHVSMVHNKRTCKGGWASERVVLKGGNKKVKANGKKKMKGDRQTIIE